ncbi:hypothetical protein Salat_0856800 [Sesamum alatum]|uniref:Uncharacterized protein n=1 Tax=Sesamum alatum TaxID=300844 RepID=A0AAE1YK22_9LAMI|nr:hypothetical protein Salat_0856800 [Sesamum alatum]
MCRIVASEDELLRLSYTLLGLSPLFETVQLAPLGGGKGWSDWFVDGRSVELALGGDKTPLRYTDRKVDLPVLTAVTATIATITPVMVVQEDEITEGLRATNGERGRPLNLVYSSMYNTTNPLVEGLAGGCD